jgi:hypothetical protein
MPGAEPLFEQVFTSRLYVLRSTSADAGWSAFLLVPPPAPPDTTISIPESFNTYNGHYLFADAAPPLATQEQADAFVANVLNYIARFGVNAQVCLWIPDPVGLNFGPHDPTSWGFAFSAGLNAVTLQSDFNHHLGSNVTLTVERSVVLALDGDGLRLSASPGQTQLAFTTSPTNGHGPVISPQVGRIPFTGAYRGAILVGGSIAPTLTLRFFSAGLRYAYAAAGGNPQQIFPVARYDSAPAVPLPFVASVDPIDTFNTGPLANPNQGVLRTQFSLVPGASATVVVPSWLRTQAGKPVGLVPVGSLDASGGPAPNAGGLVFGPRTDGGIGDPLYLTYAGDFGLAVDDEIGTTAAPRDALLCGLSGTETLTFRPYAATGQNDVLRFVANRPSYAPVFPFPAASLEAADNGKLVDRLDTTTTTSWATIVPGDAGPITYSAQPEGSPLFAPGDDQPVPSIPVLGSYPPQTAFSAVVPLVPYAGLAAAPTPGFPASVVVPFESEIVAAQRKIEIAPRQIRTLAARERALAAGASVPAPTSTSAMTPQGLLAELVGSRTDAHYASVTLARSAGGTTPDMAFYTCDAELQSALQTNQLFLVAVDPTHLGPEPTTMPPPGQAFANAVTIEDWTMRVRVGQGVSASDYRNVFIMKFCQGTLLERVMNPRKWTAPRDFSLATHGVSEEIALSGLAQWLQDYCNQAMTLAATGNTFYTNFARIVQDPDWQGILALRVDLDVASLPEQLRGLAAGIDLTQFLAHHFGIAISRVAVEGKQLSLAGPSSMFGLIDYAVPAYRAALAANINPNNPIALQVNGPYGFTVLQLAALFENSTLVDFRSHVQLTMNRFFESRVTGNYSVAGSFPINAVVLDGTYQRQATASVYVFEQRRRIVLTLDSNVLQAVAITRAQFNAQSAPTGDGTTLRSRFLLNGALDFVVLGSTGKGAEDVLSFGSPPATPRKELGAGLAFSGLAIELSSPAATPNAVTYAFDAQNLAFDLATSTPARAHSLFATFGLQLRNFIQASPDKRPPDYGFLTVRAADLALKTLDQPWFGIVYKLTMGTPGALVSQAGFDSAFLIAWSPASLAREPNAAVFLGLQLPGAAPGAKLISLQGVLKITVGGIDLLYDTSVGSTTMGYNLRLNNIGLTFLGLLKLPPSATINFFLFGDPTGGGSLGWYAAYVEDPKPTTQLLVPLETVTSAMEDVR